MTQKEFEDFEIIVRWEVEVEDGYVGKYKPQQTKIKPCYDFDLDEWNSLSDSEKREYIEEVVKEDFEQRIGFSIGDYGLN